MTQTLMQTYAQQPVQFTHGEGSWLFDDKDKRYLDAVGGIAVCALGHAHPAVTQAICEQAGQLLHTSNLYHIPKQQRLAEMLCELAGMSRVFFCNSGAEANEAALKLARLQGRRRNIANPKVIVTDKSFHGRTLATLSATGNAAIQKGFEPLVDSFVRVPFGDIDAMREQFNNPDVVAVLVEPVQGEGGVNVPPAGYLETIRQLCDQHDCLFMLDEIQTGIGRTGRWFAFQHENVKPDVMTLAKALGNGVPIGACLVSDNCKDLFQPGSHGTTFGGNPLACSAALAVLDTLRNENLIEQGAQRAEYLMTKLQQALGATEGVVDIRGKGLIIGIELDRPCTELVAQARENGLLINVTQQQVVRLLPALNISENQLDQLCDILVPLIQSFLAN